MRKTKRYYELLPQWSPRNGKPMDSYKSNSTEKVLWICSKGHEWPASVKGRFSGHECPYCGGRLPVIGVNDAATLFPELVAQWHPEKNGTGRLSDYLPKSDKKAWWICPKGHEWQARIAGRVNGRGCPYCAGRLPCAENNLLSVFPRIAAMWNYGRNKKAPEEYLPHSSARVWWICPKGHEWDSTIHTMTNATRNRGCPYCYGRRPIVGETDLASRRPELVGEWDYELNDKGPEEYSYMSNKEVHWICPNGHRYSAKIGNRSKGRGCSLCSRGW